MKKLTTSVDSRNRDLSDVYEISNVVNYYPSTSGDSPVEIPLGASFLGISTFTEGVWYRVGDEEVSCVAPPDAVEDGSAPNYLIPNSKIIHRILSETHIALDSDGPVVLSYWGQ